MNIGDLFVSLMVDNEEEFKKDISGVTEAAAEEASKGFAQRLLGGIGSARGALSSILSSGPIRAIRDDFAQLDRAVADFTATTGASAEEAEAARIAINRMAGQSLQPITEIGDVLTIVRKDWQLTGEEAERATERVLRFAQATGQDASIAAGNFDDIMDRLNVGVEEAADIMDALVFNTQKYGGTVSDQTAALKQLIPTLTAANMSWEEGVGILGFFEGVGVQSTQAVMALGRAVRTLKPGENLQDLFDRLSDIEDSAERQTLALRLFGRSAGPQLANALANGRVALKDYVLAQDQYTGSVDRAREASLTWADRFQLVLNDISSRVIAFIGPGGPLLTMASTFTQLFGPAMQGALRAAGTIFQKGTDLLVKVAGGAGAEMAAEMGGGFLGELSASTIAEGAAGTIGGNLTAQAVTFSKVGMALGLAGSQGVAETFVPGAAAAGVAAGLAASKELAEVLVPGAAAAGLTASEAMAAAMLEGQSIIVPAQSALGKAAGEAYGFEYNAATGRWHDTRNKRMVKFATVEAHVAAETGAMAGAANAAGFERGQATGVRGMAGRLGAVFAGIGTAVGSAFSAALAIASNPITWVVGLVAGLLVVAGDPKLQEAAWGIARGILDFIVNGLKAIGKGAGAIAQALLDLIADAVKGLLGGLGSLFQTALDLGANIAKTIAGGITGSDDIPKAVEGELKDAQMRADETPVEFAMRMAGSDFGATGDGLLPPEEAERMVTQAYDNLLAAVGGNRARAKRILEQVFMPGAGQDAAKDALRGLFPWSDPGVYSTALHRLEVLTEQVNKERLAKEAEFNRTLLGDSQTGAGQYQAQLVEQFNTVEAISARGLDDILDTHIAAQRELKEQQDAAAALIGLGLPEDIAIKWKSEGATLEEAARFMMSDAAAGVEYGVRRDVVEKAGMLPEFLAEQLRKSGGGIAAGVNRAFSVAGEAARGAFDQVKSRLAEEAKTLAPSIRDTIQSQRGELQKAMKDLQWALRHPFADDRLQQDIIKQLHSPRLRRALKSRDEGIRAQARDQQQWLEANLDKGNRVQWLKAQLGSKGLRQRLKSSDPDIRKDAQRRRDALRAQLENVRKDADTESGKASDNLRTGLSEKDAKVKNDAENRRTLLKTVFQSMSSDAATWGKTIAMNFAIGLASQAALDAAQNAADALAQKFADPTEPGSPTKTGPLSRGGGTYQWGKTIAEDWWAGIASAKPEPLAGLDSPGFTASAARGAVMAAPTAVAPVAGGGDTYNFTPSIHGLPLQAHTPREVVSEMRRSARLGLAMPKRRQQEFSPT